MKNISHHFEKRCLQKTIYNIQFFHFVQIINNNNYMF